MNNDIAINYLKSHIEDLKEKLKYIKNCDDDILINGIAMLEQEIDNLQGSVAMLTSFKNESLRLKNNKLRIKSTKSKDTVYINIIIKEGKQYAVVPMEILPEYITF